MESGASCGHAQCARCIKEALRRQMDNHQYYTQFSCPCSCRGQISIESVPKDAEVTAWVAAINSHIQLRTFIQQKRNNEELL